jgi:hypothetical protein
MTNRNIHIVLISITILSAVFACASEWVSFTGAGLEPEPPVFTVLGSNAERTVLRIDIQGMLVGEIEVGGETFDKLEIPEYLYTGEVGKAQIPALGGFIAIPGMKDFSVDIMKTESITLDGYYVYPAQETFIEEQPPFAKDETFYQTNAFYPSETVELGGASIWRDLRVINPAIFPIKYNPVTSQLEVTYSITLRFSYFGTSNDNIIAGPDYPDYAIEERYAQSYRSSIVNYDSLGLEEVYWKLGNPCDYLIIYSSPWESWFLNASGLVDHISSRGFSVKAVGTDETGTAPEQIKNYIRNEYNQHHIDYVLLVGDNVIPARKILPARYENTDYDDYESDYYYTLLAGDDIVPEVSLGRLAAIIPQELENGIDKIIAYENGAAPGPWPENNLLVAHHEHWDDDDTDFDYTKDCIKDWDYATHDPVFETAYGADGATNADVTYLINDGCGTVNYAGHGNGISWSSWSFNEEDWSWENIDALTNGKKTPVVYNMCCKTGYPSWLATDWVFDNPDRGAVGSVGFTEVEWITQTNFMDKYIYHALYHHDVPEFGNSLDHARGDLVKKMSSQGEVWKNKAADVILMSVLYGDPSMPVRTGALADFYSVEYGHSAIIGPNHKDVIVTGPEAARVEDAVVCLFQPGGVHYAKGTDNAGTASFDFVLNSTEDIRVTVWKPGYVTYSGIIEVNE